MSLDRRKGMSRIELRAAGREAPMLLTCYAHPPHKKMFLLAKLIFGNIMTRLGL